MPYVSQATALATGASNPLTQSQIQNYYNPYVQNVVDTTQAAFNNSNQQQQAGLTGNSIAQGALGGNRVGVAQGVLAGQQQAAQAPIIAGLESQGYNQAVQTAAQQYQQNPLAAANSIANYGISGANSALAGANAQINAGTLEQQTQQAQDSAAYQQFQNQQAFPYQQASYYASLAGPVAAALGTQSTGSTTGPAPNSLNTILGGIGSGVGALGATGAFGSSGWLASALPALALSDARAKENIEPIGKADNGQTIYKFNYKGNLTTHIGFLAQEVEKSHPEAVHNIAGLKAVDYDAATRADGGVVRRAQGGYTSGVAGFPYGGAKGYIPDVSLSIHGLSAAPFPQSQNQQQSQNAGLSGLGNIASAFKGLGSSPNSSGSALPYGSSIPGAVGPTSVGGAPLVQASAFDPTLEGSLYARGGGVAGFRGYSDGGTPTDSIENRFDPVKAAIADGTFDPQGINSTTFEGTPGMVAANSGAVPLPMARPAGAPGMDIAGVAANDEGGDGAAMSYAPTPGIAGLPQQITAPSTPFARDNAQAGFAGAPGGNGQSSFGPGLSPNQGLAMSPGGQQAERSNNFWPALMAAGLGMMASRSPYWGVALGEGGLQGLKTYSDAQAADLKARQDAIKQAQDDRRIEMEAQRLQMAAQEAARAAAAAPISADGKINQTYLDLKKKEADINQKDNWAVIGNVMAADGSLHPLGFNKADHSTIDLVTQKPPQTSDRIQALPGKGPDPSVVQHNVEGIASGRQPPTLTGLYGMSGAVRAGLEEKGFDLAKAQMEWDRAKKQTATLNGPQMTRFVGLAHSVDSTIDEVRDLSKQMNMSGIPALNNIELAAYIKTQGNSANGQLATRYIAAVNTLKEEFANLANGGYAPTEPAWRLAGEQINGNYGVGQLGASLDEVQRLIRYRVNAIPGLSTMGPGTENRYTGQSGQQSSPTSAPVSTAPQRPANVPSGSAYSASLNKWRSPDGTIFNADGSRP